MQPWRPYNEPVVILAVVAVSAIFLGNGPVAMAGYASPTVWLVFSAFLIGSAIIETGLGRRIAFFLVGGGGKSTSPSGMSQRSPIWHWRLRRPPCAVTRTNP
ncbi:anion permease [Bradyrhizobium sp. PMVTL-01]|uniref:anion permease n=1 Tax=Bradyrhizobium sp. PMVTL-01 TaxID=3434999 RepID=UPI003F70D835